MDMIIKDIFKRYYPEPEQPVIYREDSEHNEWLKDLALFTFGWKCCNGWGEEQELIDKDRVDELKQEEYLAEGLG